MLCAHAYKALLIVHICSFVFYRSVNVCTHINMSEFDKNLIELVEEFPFLYNKKNLHYKNNHMKSNAWKTISERLGKTGVCSSKSLKGMTLTVPRAVRVGHSVTLGCDYDLEGAPLYSVKWYRGSDEFYRYVPKEEPPTRVFSLPGLHIDVSVSNARKVTLLSVGRALSGLFQCEVSADAPLFHTEMKSAPMTVAVVPDGVPAVSVDRAGLERGGPLIAECRAPPAYPAPNLTWYVNDQRVPGATSSSVSTDSDQMETATSKLELTGVGGSWGAIRLRCEGTLFRLYRANSLEVEVKPDTPQPASVLLMGPSLNGNTTAIASRYLLLFAVTSVLTLVIVRCRSTTS